ncbi:hypothetical protein ACO0LQ_000338 [Salmonella enterica]|nr:DUF3251 domain-containing protein [Salmonella enterica subsp. enterica serovar India]EBP4523200.1 DUF3251 domain-containing protein [Salmonella enterica]EBU7936475.1 hypothetical protein [Salmonella enterica subsp. enterica serovar Chittagong]ECI2729379.1 DUF3251 domain-containing protein [Salmonella enterica subsp. enterica]EDH3989606.1 DUF3251 domain-containing protein [Salmonella enterica subsp. enterica serovar Westminster]EDN7239071.1 DUF3251 domain-containing protein [Salmonella enter
MPLNKILICVLTASSVCALSGCDYVDKIKNIDTVLKQQEEQKTQIALLKKQEEEQKARIEYIQKQQVNVISGTKKLALVVKDMKAQQDTFLFTEFNPAHTKYFILNNGSIGLAGRILSIDATENGSVIRISLVNLLSVSVNNIGFHATWGGERPTDPKAYAKWQQLLFNTTMNSSLKLLPGQWQDIDLTLKGVSPNNLKYLKLAINMENIQFDNPELAASQQKKNKK